MVAMSTQLQRVQAKLSKLKGQALFDLADAVGISYDTLIRIRENRTDPAFGKVQRLTDHFEAERAARKRAAA